MKNRAQLPFYRIVIICVIWFLMVACRFDVTRDSSFDKISENLVCSVLYAKQNGIEYIDQKFGLGTLYLIEDGKVKYFDFSSVYQDTATFYSSAIQQEENEYRFGFYRSQLGWQGKVYGMLAKLFPSPKLYWAIRLLLIGALEAVLLWISYELGKKYGLLMGMVFLLTSVGSPWLTKFAPSLYWCEFLWFIPMLLGVLCMNHPKKKWIIYPFFYFAITIKCACGYEYLSTIMLSSILYIVVEAIVNKPERIMYIKMIFTIGMLELLGFFTTFFLHTKQSGVTIMQMLHDLVLGRTYGSSEEFSMFPSEAFDATVFETVGKYFWHNMAGKVNLLLLILGCACLLLERRCYKVDNKKHIVMFFIAFLTGFSWIVLAKEHSYMHTPLNFVVFHIGCIQMEIYIIVHFVKEYLGKIGDYGDSK